MKLKQGQIYTVRPGEHLRHEDPRKSDSDLLRGGDTFVVLSGLTTHKKLEPKTLSGYYYILTGAHVRRIWAHKDMMYIVGIHAL